MTVKSGLRNFIVNSTIESNHNVLIGDVFACLNVLEDSIVDCAITSPPYWDQRDYGFKGQIGNEENLNEYISKLVTIFSLLRNKLKPEGIFYLNIGDKYINKYGNTPLGMIPYKLAYFMQLEGWIVVDTIIWYKPNHMPSSVKNRFTNTYEPIFVFAKNNDNYYTKNREKFNNIVKIPLQQNSYSHMATYPEKLVSMLMTFLELPQHSTILDPFGGSGSTTKAVINLNNTTNLNLNSILIEAQIEYLNIILERCSLSKNNIKEIPFREYKIIELKSPSPNGFKYEKNDTLTFDYRSEIYIVKFSKNIEEMNQFLNILNINKDIVYDEGVIFFGLPNNDVRNLFLISQLDGWIIRNIIVIPLLNSWIPLVLLVKDTKLVNYELDLNKILVNHKNDCNMQYFDTDFVGYKVFRSKAYFLDNKTGLIVKVINKKSTGLPNTVVVKWEDGEITVEEVINEPVHNFKMEFSCPKCKINLVNYFKNRKVNFCPNCKFHLWKNIESIPNLSINLFEKDHNLDKFININIEKKNTKKDYQGKFANVDRKNMGQSPGARSSVSDVYFSTQRYYKFPHGLFNDYLNLFRQFKGYSKKQLTEMFPSSYKHTVGHWFRNDMGGCIPKIEDLLVLKQMLNFGDEYFELAGRMGIKLQSVIANSNGKNPGDYLEINKDSFIDMIKKLSD